MRKLALAVMTVSASALAGPAMAAELVQADGSSTVFPITEAVAEEFQNGTEYRMTVGVSGTGGGFSRFCRGETDVTGASRPIRTGEREKCREAGIQYYELPVALDAMAVMVNPSNDWVDQLTVKELQKVWEPEAEGKITNWSQIRDGFPDRPLKLYGAGADSGTYDYFTAAVVGQEHASRGDFTASEDDNVLVQGIANDRNALGFFGLAYYLENKDMLKAVPISYKGSEPVMPSKETAESGAYQPLTRPLFMYVKKSAYEDKASVRAFVQDYLLNPSEVRPLVDEVGYIRLPAEVYRLAQRASSSKRNGPVRRSPAAPRSVSRSRTCWRASAPTESGRPRTRPGPGLRPAPDFSIPYADQRTRPDRSGEIHSMAMNPTADLQVTEGFLRRRARIDRFMRGLLFVTASISVLVTIGIIYILVRESITFFQEVSIVEFLTGTRWTPLFMSKHFGILPLLSATLTVSVVALLVAIPGGTVVAVYLSEFAPDRVREVVKPVLELLEGIPTVVYGYFALLFVTPMLRIFLPQLGGFNLLAPGLVMGIMILPYVTSVSEDAMRAVPNSLREGAHALGFNRLQTALRVVIPGALSGITAACVLGMSRAVGETMVVAIAAGQNANLTFNPMEAAATIPAYIVQVSLGDTPHGSIAYQTIFAAGLMLFLITLTFNVIGFFLRRRFREAY
ncbi:MAG: phosphate ABC transporter permease subunit PstC [Halofilum sp. (in: g-proteobacteria)]|nr:phosphate ABC transporter permease subunit PstC [Halofilum sp. (in: g-proteobacteria)]